MSKKILPERLTLKTDQLWPLVILAGFAFFVSLVPISPNDFWWHLKIGEVIFTEGHIPSSNLYGWTLGAEDPFIYGAWLGELLLYLAYRIGELPLVIFLRNLLVISAYGLMAYETHRRSKSWRAGTLAIALLAAMTLNNLIVRPQIWSWLPFIAFFILLSKYTAGELHKYWLLLLPLIMVFWVNAHGAYILGGVMIGIYFVGEIATHLFKLPSALTWKQIAWLLFIGLLTGVAMLINPQFTGTVGYVIDLMTDQPSQSLIVEWQSPNTQGIANIFFYVSILVLIISFAYSRRKVHPTEILLCSSFLWLAWTGMRYIVWYGMIVMPIVATQLIHLPIKYPKLIPQRNWINNLLGIVLFLPAVFVQPWFVSSFPLPQTYIDKIQQDSGEGPLLDWANPIRAGAYLKENPGGNLFNEMGYGSYLIWAVPDQGVFIDPRVELYPFEQWQDYIRITRGADYNTILSRYNVDRLIIDKILQPELSTILEKDDLWLLEYEDERAQIWYKKGTR